MEKYVIEWVMDDIKDLWYDRSMFIMSEIVFYKLEMHTELFTNNMFDIWFKIFQLKSTKYNKKNLATIGKILIIIEAEWKLHSVHYTVSL